MSRNKHGDHLHYAWMKGQAARHAGKSLKDCPYMADLYLGTKWEAGWRSADAYIRLYPTTAHRRTESERRIEDAERRRTREPFIAAGNP